MKCVEYKYKYVQYVYKIKLKGVGIQSTPLFGRAVFHAGGGAHRINGGRNSLIRVQST